MKLPFNKNYEILGDRKAQILGGEPGGPPYFYVLLRDKRTRRVHEINLGCVGKEDFSLGPDEMRRRILDKITEIENA